MRRRNLSLPMLVSFNELAWIAAFAMALLFLAERASNRKATSAAESQPAIATKSAVATKTDSTQSRIGMEKGIRKELLGLRGHLRNVVFVVDRSGSMKDRGAIGTRDRWTQARLVIKTWMVHLEIEKCVLITFSDDVSVFPPSGEFLDMRGSAGADNRKAIVEELKRLTPAGNTNTLAALRRAYSCAGVDTIILFTDGVPDPHNRGFDQTMAAEVHRYLKAQNRSVPTNAVGLSNYFDPRFGQFLIDVAQTTGGTFVGR